MIAIGGGGYVPARILRSPPPFLLQPSIPAPRETRTLTFPTPHRSFLKRANSPNIPIQAIGLSLYENFGTDGPVEEPGTKVTRTQWLDLSSLEMKNLVGKNILIVDEVDDTRTTLEYAVRELQKDVETARVKMGVEGETRLSVFVLHVSAPCASAQSSCHLCSYNDADSTWVDVIGAEQRQSEERPSSHQHDAREKIHRRENRRRCLDMLSLGGNVRPLSHPSIYLAHKGDHKGTS